MLRLNLNAHPLSYVNDQDLGTAWLSKVMSTQELEEGITITVDLANGQYQVLQLFFSHMNCINTCKMIGKIRDQNFLLW